jgi:hypothetical protein
VDALYTETPLGRLIAATGAIRRHDRLVPSIAFFALAYAAFAYINNGRVANLNYFVPLADALLHGRVGLLEGPSWLNELVPRDGLFYVVYPPMPAILALPFVAIFGPDVDQARITFFYGALNVVLAWHVIDAMGVRRWQTHLLTLVFAFGMITWYSAQAGSSWHFAHVSVFFFCLLAIRAVQGNRSPWLIGLLFAGAILSRLEFILALPFFLAYFADRSSRIVRGEPDTVFGRLGSPEPRARLRSFPVTEFLAHALPFAVPVVGSILLYGAYDDARFGSPLQTGYMLIPGVMQEYQYRFGLFSYQNIPRNLYSLLLTVPVQVESFPWVQPRLLGGLSILLTTPLFLWAIRSRGLSWFSIGAWLSLLLLLIPILFHADPGGAQFGFRYAQDLYPFLLLLTVRGLRNEITFEAGLAIALGFLVNFWGIGCAYFNWWA